MLEQKYERTSRKIEQFSLSQGVIFNYSAGEKAQILNKHLKDVALHRRGMTEAM